MKPLLCRLLDTAHQIRNCRASFYLVGREYTHPEVDSPNHDLALTAVQLIKWLRRFPYWSRGHLLLAEQALRHSNMSLAYSSAHAVLTLPARGNVHFLARYTLGRCYLAAGKPELAMPYFIQAHDRLPNRYEITEDLAACHMALGSNSEALKLLNSIPVSYTHLTLPTMIGV